MATDQLLRRLLAAYVVDVDGGPANYSVRIGDPEGTSRSARPVHMLFRSSQAVARSRNPARVVRALLAHLGPLLEPPAPELLRVRAVAVVAGGRAALLPAGVGADLKSVQPHLRRAGIRLADVPHATIDPADGTLVVAAPELELDTKALAELDRMERSARADDPTVEPGRYPLAAMVFFAGDPAGPLPLGRARLWVYPSVVGGAGIGSTLEGVDRVLARTRAVSTTSSGPALVRWLADVVASA